VGISALVDLLVVPIVPSDLTIFISYSVALLSSYDCNSSSISTLIPLIVAPAGIAKPKLVALR